MGFDDLNYVSSSSPASSRAVSDPNEGLRLAEHQRGQGKPQDCGAK